MTLSAQTLRALKPVDPFHERTVFEGMTYGLGPCGYDVRLAEQLRLAPGEFLLGSTMEHFTMPSDIVGQVTDKSTWARRGLSLFNTIIEPGWRGWLTLELKNQSDKPILIERGSPIAQVIFSRLDFATDTPYNGKYQDQPRGAVQAIDQPDLPFPAKYTVVPGDDGLTKIYKAGKYIAYVDEETGWLNIIGANNYAIPVAECPNNEAIPGILHKHYS